MNNGKVYLILGASSDLGRNLIEQLCQQSSNSIKIVAHYRSSSEKLYDLKKFFPDAAIIPLQADMQNFDEVDMLIQKMQISKLYPDCIINFCAREYRFMRFEEWDSTKVNADMTVQVYALAEILKAFLPYMVQKRYGKIVTMLSSVLIGAPPKNLSEYVMVKYAVLGLIKAVASDYGDKGININGISPNMINTRFISNIGRKIKEFAAANNPRHRNLEVEDVIPTILFLLSDNAQFINGTNINLSACAD